MRPLFGWPDLQDVVSTVRPSARGLLAGANATEDIRALRKGAADGPLVMRSGDPAHCIAKRRWPCAMVKNDDHGRHTSAW